MKGRPSLNEMAALFHIDKQIKMNKMPTHKSGVLDVAAPRF
jgi:hypothetical protein